MSALARQPARRPAGKPARRAAAEAGPAASPARRAPSAVTIASEAFVAEHRRQAAALGERLAGFVADPEGFATALSAGLAELGDPAVVAGIRSVTPGLGPVLGVRLPLLDGAHKAFRRGTRKTSTALLLDCIDRLQREEYCELRWFGMWSFGRLLVTDPERTWQLMRAAAREAGEWITVDTLAHPYAEGILREPRRWAEIEQLVYSPSRWERRLVGSTLATMPHVNLPGSRDKPAFQRGLALIGQLIGDNEPDVQKALSWALRSYAALDPAAVGAFLDEEVQTARRTRDGNRAWVIRDTLAKLPDEAERYRQILDGIRRQPGGPSTSTAATTAAAFLASAGGPGTTHRSED
jgi:3-methyladenine DNA glycosylase AlkD